MWEGMRGYQPIRVGGTETEDGTIHVCVRVRGCVCVSAFVYVCTLGSGGSAIA